eukprot:3141253-Alexandrium_andersonii.AAC.1
MSASLVGSEMCIRDSDYYRPAARDRGEGPVDPAAADPGPKGEQPNKGGPVSYTHLTLPTICSV